MSRRRGRNLFYFSGRSNIAANPCCGFRKAAGESASMVASVSLRWRGLKNVLFYKKIILGIGLFLKKANF